MAKMTQAELAEAVGMNEVQVWRFENNTKGEPRADTVLKFAHFFNVSTDYLLGNSDNPYTNVGGELEGIEIQVLAALRRGDRMAAIRVIANDNLKKIGAMS